MKKLGNGDHIGDLLRSYIEDVENIKEQEERIDSRLGRHITEYAEEIGLGSTKYELIEI